MNMIKKRILTFFSLTFFVISSPVLSQSHWEQWVENLRKEALSQGISPALFDRVFQHMLPLQQTLFLDRTQPEKRISFKQYLKTRGDSYRIQLGRSQYKRYKPLLNSLEQRYGVNSCIILSLWGMESSYGRYLGTFPVIQTLATLAYDTRRAAFFRNELLIALHILDEGHIDNEHFKGEWAGASGHPQFLPSSWKKYAVDYDGDGYKNIWTDIPDGLASIANYLSLNGWQAREPWALEISLPPSFSLSGNEVSDEKNVGDWLNMGIQFSSSSNISSHLPARIFTPAGGPYFMIFHNFDVIKEYNHSNFYAGTVGYMANRMCSS